MLSRVHSFYLLISMELFLVTLTSFSTKSTHLALWGLLLLNPSTLALQIFFAAALSSILSICPALSKRLDQGDTKFYQQTRRRFEQEEVLKPGKEDLSSCEQAIKLFTPITSFYKISWQEWFIHLLDGGQSRVTSQYEDSLSFYNSTFLLLQSQEEVKIMASILSKGRPTHPHLWIILIALSCQIKNVRPDVNP
uniref:Uncharacterized protein n=1 Tax=Megaselia scalaris TaxID=36166 RepID=T1GDQ2_MEGSC